MNSYRSTDVTFESVMTAMQELKKLGTPHGPIVLSAAQWDWLKQEIAIGEPVAWPQTFFMIQVEIVETEQEVMPRVHELRRRGKRPAFVGMIH